MTKRDDGDPRQRLRSNRNDPLHDRQLQRDVQAINEQTQRALGPLPPDGLPVQPKRKPRLPRPSVAPATATLPPSDEDTTMQWKSMAAAAALATGGTLTACGAEGTTAREDAPAVTVPQTPAPASLPRVEAESPARETTVVKPAGSADANTSEPERGPAIPAARLRQQILALLGSFKTLEDLERENVERAFSVRMKKASDMREGYEYDGITFEGWGYGILNAKLDRMNQPATTLIGLHHGVEPFTNQQPTYCTLEFEPLAKELVAMGYERGLRARYSGGDWTWGFGRESAEGNARFGIGVSVYNVTLQDGTKQVCIKGFDIGGS